VRGRRVPRAVEVGEGPTVRVHLDGLVIRVFKYFGISDRPYAAAIRVVPDTDRLRRPAVPARRYAGDRPVDRVEGGVDGTVGRLHPDGGTVAVPGDDGAVAHGPDTPVAGVRDRRRDTVVHPGRRQSVTIERGECPPVRGDFPDHGARRVP